MEGTGDFTNKHNPVLILKNKKIKKIFCGYNTSFFLTEEGELFGMGEGSRGNMGIGSSQNQPSPVCIMKDNNIQYLSSGLQHTVVLKNGGYLWGFGSSLNGELGIAQLKISDIPTPVMQGVMMVTCGGNFTLIYTFEGTLLACGA